MSMPSVAPDYSRFERRQAVVEPEVPLELVEEPIIKKVIERTRMPYKALAGCVLVSLLLVAVIFSYNRMWTVNAENLRLEREYQALITEYHNLQRDFEGHLTGHEINIEAREYLGMLPPMSDQIVYLNLGGQDRAVVYTQDGFFTRIWNMLTGLFG